MTVRNSDVVAPFLRDAPLEQRWDEALEQLVLRLREEMQVHIHAPRLGEVKILTDGAREYALASTKPSAIDGSLNMRGLFFVSPHIEWHKGNHAAGRYIWGITKGTLVTAIVGCEADTNGFLRRASSVAITEHARIQCALREAHVTQIQAFRQLKDHAYSLTRHRRWLVERAEALGDLFSGVEDIALALIGREEYNKPY